MRRARWIATARVGWLAAVGVTLGTSGFAAAVGHAADKPVGQLVGPEKKIFQTEDGKSVHATYFKSPGDQESPVVVLLHMKDGNRFVWQGAEEDSFARRLQKEQFAVITVDLRYHGESKIGGAVGAGNANQGTGKKKDKKAAGLDLKPADLEAMVLDVEAVKDFIKEEHQAKNLNMNKMGIVGPEMGATVAVYYALYDWDKEPYEDGQPGFQTPRGQDVRALVLISPQEKFHGTPINKPLAQLKDPDLGISYLVCCGSDPQDFKESDKIYKLLTTPAINEKRMFFRQYKNARIKGTDLLDKGLDLEVHMLTFFDKQLKQLDAPWRDRESKRNKLDKKKK